MLEILCSGNEIDKSYVSDDQLNGISILGTNGAYVGKDGVLRGKIIAEIDLSSPLDSIAYEISRLKNKRFPEFPDFMDMPDLTSFYGDFQILSEIIKYQTNSSFSVNDDPARAIGLWFWDMLSGPDPVFANFAELWTLIATRNHADFCVEDELPVDMSDSSGNDSCFIAVAKKDNPDLVKIIPTLQVFSQLGYAASDPSVFRRLYRNTQKCVEACEVLSLK